MYMSIDVYPGSVMDISVIDSNRTVFVKVGLNSMLLEATPTSVIFNSFIRNTI
jgi:hypothetical protein